MQDMTEWWSRVYCLLLFFVRWLKEELQQKGEMYTMGMRQKSGEGQPAGQFVSVYSVLKALQGVVWMCWILYCKSIHICSIEYVNLKVYRRQALPWHNRVMHPICIAYFLSQFACLVNAAVKSLFSCNSADCPLWVDICRMSEHTWHLCIRLQRSQFVLENVDHMGEN